MIRLATTLLFIFSLILCNSLQGQINNDSTQVVATEIPKNLTDTSKYSELAQKSPLGAILRSLAIPGWGQIYVQQYWKAPIFFAGAVVMYYYVFKHNKDYLDYSQQYDRLKEINPNSIELYYLKIRKENSRDNRDISIFFLCGVYALSILDAYVDANLFNFNVNESLSVRVTNHNWGIAFTFQIRR